MKKLVQRNDPSENRKAIPYLPILYVVKLPGVTNYQTTHTLLTIAETSA